MQKGKTETDQHFLCNVILYDHSFLGPFPSP